jgi:hypothetical protein
MCTGVLFSRWWWCPMINNSQNSVPDRYVCASVLCSFVLPFLFLSLSLSLPVHFYSSFVVHVKVALELLKYIHTRRRRGRERVQAVFSFFSVPIRVTTQSCICMLARDQWVDITSHTNTHHQEKRSKVEARTKTCSNFFFSFPPFLFYIKNNDHNLSLSLSLSLSNFSFWQINRTKEEKKKDDDLVQLEE